MRHTRNRQLRKINSVMECLWTCPIDISKKEIWNDKLDKSFKWHRRYNNVSFNIFLYGDMPVTLYVDLYNKDSLYF